MALKFLHYTNNGTIIPDREAPILIESDTDLRAIYEEKEMSVVVKLRNSLATDQHIVKITTEDLGSIAPGETKSIVYDETKDILVLVP
jgi:hypothetical protein